MAGLVVSGAQDQTRTATAANRRTGWAHGWSLINCQSPSVAPGTSSVGFEPSTSNVQRPELPAALPAARTRVPSADQASRVSGLPVKSAGAIARAGAVPSASTTHSPWRLASSKGHGVKASRRPSGDQVKRKASTPTGMSSFRRPVPSLRMTQSSVFVQSQRAAGGR